MLEKMERTKDLEASISFHQTKLEQKNQLLMEKEEVETGLREENNNLQDELNYKNQELLAM